MNEEAKKKIVEHLGNQVTEIPTLPKMVTRILDMMDDPNAKIEEVAEAILQDTVLTTRIIRLVNSVFFGIQREISSIREAIIFLGQNQVKNIVLTSSLFSVFPNQNNKFDMVSLWEHGLGCAMICRVIAEYVKFNDIEKAYLGGLLHDLGEIVLSQYYQDKFELALECVQNEHLEFHVAEQKILGIDHTDFSFLFQEHWGFSEEITEVIAFHHAPEKAKTNRHLVCIVNLANTFCKVRGLDYGYPPNIQVSLKDEFSWKELLNINPAINELDMERFTLSMDGKIDNIKTVVKSLYRG